MNYVFFDLETQNLFDDVGGRANVSQLKMSCGVTWSEKRGDFAVYWERDAPALIRELQSAAKVIGFNLKGFDYLVLQPYAPNVRFASIPTLDMFFDLRQTLGFAVGLENVASATLGTGKSADGVQAVEWFRAGELDKLAEYCKMDVDVSRRVFEFGRDNGFVYYKSKLGSRLKAAVNWK